MVHGTESMGPSWAQTGPCGPPRPMEAAGRRVRSLAVAAVEGRSQAVVDIVAEEAEAERTVAAADDAGVVLPALADSARGLNLPCGEQGVSQQTEAGWGECLDHATER